MLVHKHTGATGIAFALTLALLVLLAFGRSRGMGANVDDEFPGMQRGPFLRAQVVEENEMRQAHAIQMRGQSSGSSSTGSWCVAALCRAITYAAAVSPLLLILILARLYPDFNRTRIPDWRPLISFGDAASNRGERYEARRLFLQVDRVAYSQKDWQGLVAAACRINKLEGVTRPSSKAISILFRASTTAELAQSYRGLATVALSLSMLGSDEAAFAVLDRIEAHWPNEPITSDDLALLEGC